MSTHMPSVLPFDVRLMNLMASTFCVCLGIGLSLYTSWWVMQRPIFLIERISVHGDVGHHNEVTLRANVASSIVGNFFTLDVIKIRAAFEAIPWVRSAVVRKFFPNALHVRIEEHQSVGLWGGGGESRLVNSYGEVFEANLGETEIETLPVLAGPDRLASHVVSTYKVLNELLVRHACSITYLELTEQGVWRMQIDAGTSFELGRGDIAKVQARLSEFLSTYSQIGSTHRGGTLERVESVDLRYNTGYAIKLRGIGTTSLNGINAKE